MTIEEIDLDLKNNTQDIALLETIVKALKTFIIANGGENRNHLRVRLMELESLLATANRLQPLIEEARVKALTLAEVRK